MKEVHRPSGVNLVSHALYCAETRGAAILDLEQRGDWVSSGIWSERRWVSGRREGFGLYDPEARSGWGSVEVWPRRAPGEHVLGVRGQAGLVSRLGPPRRAQIGGRVRFGLG